MTPRALRSIAAVLALTALIPLAACSNDTGDAPATDHKPTKSPPGPSDDALVAKNARAYMVAQHAQNPADAKTMCELSTRAHRPNFDDDGGTIAGCRSSYWRDIGEGDDDSTRSLSRLARARASEGPPVEHAT
ncbi:conserved exported protein of unknown function [Streptomyces ambofaciens ATCC 23877]|uniref:Lipoprotein n=1 Tax=Streptomyces ambofaciens (strain ATCC 23877 / 3486 / DSM 40053 / JCM 4204 / NBRC 12836 / NRRL B-2516) TaxID=278992 RepID=A0AE82_STRA7|nr:hypothetical protein [Streptomyces ambofaciens]AKZ59534.1 conserved exported protein of unknown function [Streptomyces ambofaciens ATCC 23877]CAJ88791.1 hypothetical protein SAMR1082 [Streptomyces ambofaciens ATCC 23877]